MNIKLTLLLPLLLLMGTAATAQGIRKEMRERMEQFRKEYLTEAMALDEATAQKFWPIDERHSAERQAIKKQVGELMTGMVAKSDAQLEQDMANMLELKEKEVQLDKQFYNEMKAVLSIRQLAAYYLAEQRLKQELLQRLRQREKGRG
jgi:hypothetical protein